MEGGERSTERGARLTHLPGTTRSLALTTMCVGAHTFPNRRNSKVAQYESGASHSAGPGTRMGTVTDKISCSR